MIIYRVKILNKKGKVSKYTHCLNSGYAEAQVRENNNLTGLDTQYETLSITSDKDLVRILNEIATTPTAKDKRP